MAPIFIREGCGANSEEHFVITDSTTSLTSSVTSASCFHPRLCTGQALASGQKETSTETQMEVRSLKWATNQILYQMSTWLHKLIWSPKKENKVRNEVEKGMSVKQRGDKPSICLLNLNFQSKPSFQFPEKNGIQILTLHKANQDFLHFY